MDTTDTPGSRIRALRKRHPRLTADEASDAIGISRTHLSMIETGGDLPGRETLVAIANYYGVSVEYILNGGDAAPEAPKASECVDDPDELALLNFWRSLDASERRVALRLLGGLKGDV